MTLVVSLALVSCDEVPASRYEAGPSSSNAGTDVGPRFVPSTYIEGDSVVLPVTFPEGSQAELLFPASLGLGDLTAGVGISEAGLHRRCGPDPFIFPTPAGSIGSFVEEESLASFDGLADSIELHRATSDTIGHYLVFTFGSWTVAFPCASHNQGLIEEEAAIWAAHLGGQETPDGFLVLEATKPLVLARAGSTSYGIELGIGSSAVPGLFLEIFLRGGCKNAEVHYDALGTRFCLEDGDGGISVTVFVEEGDEQFVDDVIAGLRVRDITFAE